SGRGNQAAGKGALSALDGFDVLDAPIDEQERAVEAVLAEIVDPLLAALIAIALVARHGTPNQRVVVGAARRRLAAARDKLADADAAVIAIRIAVVADLV